MNTTHRPKIKQHQRHVKRQRSAKQIKRQRSFTQCSNAWTKLALENQNTWSTFAVGDETNYHAFMRCNIIRVYNDVPIVSQPDPSWL